MPVRWNLGKKWDRNTKNVLAFFCGESGEEISAADSGGVIIAYRIPVARSSWLGAATRARV